MANPPIIAPAFRGDVARVRELLLSDPDSIAIRDAKNLTPLHVAASRGKEHVVRLLLAHGADVHGPSEDDQWTPIVFASYRGHLEAAKVLIEYGAGISDQEGNPIHFAGQRKHKEICRLLAQHGAVDNLVESGDSKLVDWFRAAYSYDPVTVEAMLQASPEYAHAVDKNGRTALHEACTNGDTKTVRVLLKHAADPAVKDRAGQTPLDRATAHRQHGVAELLNDSVRK